MEKDIYDSLPKTTDIINISHGQNTVTSKNSYYDIKYYQTEFYNENDYVKFIKSIEKLVRSSDKYSEYKNYLMNTIGLNTCAILGNIGSNIDDLEMHHGPILTLFDYCSIVVEAYLKRKEKVSSFIIADKILKLHFENKIQVVMLSKVAHQAAHAGKIFISLKQAWGDLYLFLQEFGDGLSDDNIYVINQYIDLSEKNKTTDNDLFELNKIRNWKVKNTIPLLDTDI